jgi:hypothetical protein
MQNIHSLKNLGLRQLDSRWLIFQLGFILVNRGIQFLLTLGN